MTFTIGRASFTNAPSAIRQSGDRLDLDINILPTTLAEAKVLRQQVLGLANNDDEPVVPLTWSDDSDYDGFYRVAGADVEPTQAYLSNKLMRARLSLERVGGGFQSPTFDVSVVAVSGARPIRSGGTADRELWIPNAYDWQSLSTSGTLRDRSTATGTVTGIGVATGTPSFGIRAADHYDGAALIERLDGGSWYPVAGRQTSGLAMGGVRVGNGLIRLTWQTDGDIEVDVYDGANWDKVVDATLVADSTTVAPTARPVVMRNSPESVVVRFDPDLDGTVAVGQPVYISVSRGQLHASIVTNIIATTLTFGDKATAASTEINATGPVLFGCYQTSNGATGHRFVFAGTLTTGSATAGRLTYGSTQRDDLMVGVNLAGTSAATGDDWSDVTDQWSGVVAATQRLVSR